MPCARVLSVNPVYKEENLISTMTSDFSFFANTRLSGIDLTMMTNSSEKMISLNRLTLLLDDDDYDMRRLMKLVLSK